MTVHYQDGSTSTASLTAPDWYSTPGPIATSYRYGPNGVVDQHPVYIGTTTLAIDPGKQAVGLTLPDQGQPTESTASLHIWALTVQPAAVGRSVLLCDVRSTTNDLIEGGPQAVEATVVNGVAAQRQPCQRLLRVTVAASRDAVPSQLSTTINSAITVGCEVIVQFRHDPTDDISTARRHSSGVTRI